VSPYIEKTIMKKPLKVSSDSSLVPQKKKKGGRGRGD
jgi:hypothetical protein